MTDWLPGFDYVLFSETLGFPYIRDVRGVMFHLTQGYKVEHAYNVYRTFPSCPHITCDRRETSRSKAQHVPLSWASYALRNLPGGCELGSTGIIQIEVVGLSEEAHDWPHEELQWLGEEVLAPILLAYPEIPLSVFHGDRMTCDEWNAWPGGLCGHRHAPENDHWDPGELNLDAILEYALRANDPDPKDEEMPDYILRNGQDLTDPWLAVYPTGTLRHVGGTEAGCLIDGKYPDGRPFLDGKTLPLVDEFDTDAYNRARVLAGA